MTTLAERSITGQAAAAPIGAADEPIYTPVFGTQAEDRLTGNNRSEMLSGRQGDDQISGRGGSDLAYGGSGDDTIRGDQGNDVLYGGGGPSYVELGAFTIAEDYTGSVTFLDEGAGYRNSLGMYKVAEDGTIYDVAVLFPNASKQGSGGDLIGGESAVAIDLKAGDQLGFFIVSNGYGKGGTNQAVLSDPDGVYELRNANGEVGNLNTDAELQLVHIDPDTGAETVVRSQYGNDLFHSPATEANDWQPNPDNYPHTVGRLNTVEGLVTLGFEDLKHGGDNDYDDTVFVVDVGQSNARVLDPNLGYGDDADDTSGPDDGTDGVDEPVTVPAASENDTLSGGSGHDKVYGMAGNDRMDGGDGDDQIWGNSGNDVADGGRGNDTLSGGKGDDDLSGGTGRDVLTGNSGNDTLSGGSDADDLDGGSGNDVLFGDTGHDVLSGGSGDDSLSGGDGNDTVNGGSGADWLYGDAGNDDLTGGSGLDTVDFSAADRSVKVDLHGHKASGMGNDTLDGIENAVGSDFDDVMKGDKRDNSFDGGAGDDQFRGLGGDDVFRGGAGDDSYVWRAKDLKSGGDAFVDTILDFEQGDTIDLSQVLGNEAREDDFDLGQWFLAEQTDSGTSLSLDLNGSGSDFAEFAVLDGVDTFDTTTDLLVI